MGLIKSMEELHLDGGIPCLDLVNSALETEVDQLVERMFTYTDLLTLSLRSGLLDQGRIKSLKTLARTKPSEAAALLPRVREIRKDMYAVFLQIALKKTGQTDKAAIDRLNQAISWARSARKFGITGNRLVHDWDEEVAGISLPLRAFLLSAEELLLNHPHNLIKKCRACAWLFLDSSRSHRRKWCNMQTCGSAAKSKRYYHRKTKS